MHPDPKPSPRDDAPLIVGIGGSAGSLTPFRELFSALPADSDMAFVVVSHQAPTGQSLLPEILAKTTQMPVCEIDGDTKALPNHVYVLPRGYSLSVRDATLAIEPIGKPSRVPLPIDHFLRDLALDRGDRAIGIVLSGTGKDGTLGLAEIRGASGLCLVQDPETAEFDGMPTSAIAAQAVDFVLPVGEMPARLLAYARAVQERHGDQLSGATSPEMERILGLIRLRGRHDFSAYKHETLIRRLERRMGFHGIDGLGDYARYLEANSEEIEALWRDWLIGVSSFFRDPEAFAALAAALPQLLTARAAERPFRVWVPGCATGEEAYSVAIVLLEALKTLREQVDVQVFATDLDPAAIETARAGRYPKAIAETVGRPRLSRFFVEEEHCYRAKRELRESIVFAVQDALYDPPFTRVDLISCRNLLIYIVPSAQQTLLSTFHFSLNPGGLLLLGSSEHVGASSELFATLDKRWRLFQRDDSASALVPVRWRPWSFRAMPEAHALPRVERPRVDVTETLRTYLAERFAPPAVVVDLRGQVQQTHGRVGAYLELPPGHANLNVVDMAREGLRVPLASALREVTTGGAATVEKTVHLNTDGVHQELHLTVGRIEDRPLPSPLLLISFEPTSPPRRPGGRARKAFAKWRRPKRAQLEEDLQHLQNDLHASVSDLRTTNEDLASANEEVQSANEELQSSNEELQTSKEETQSLNEELQTVNAELTQKLSGIEQANDDLLNLITNIEVATIFLDDRLRVKRFTPQACSVARLIDSDVGRPLADLAALVDYPDLLADAGRVLADLRPLDKQVSAPGGVWYNVRIRPYRTTRNAVEGLVITFIDITETKRAERSQTALLLAESMLDAVHEPLLVLDSSLLVARANRAFYETFRAGREETEGRALAELGSGQWRAAPLRRLLEATLRDGSAFEGFEVVHEAPGLGRRRMIVSGRPVSMADDEKPVLIVLGIQDAGPTSAVVSEEEVEK